MASIDPAEHIATRGAPTEGHPPNRIGVRLLRSPANSDWSDRTVVVRRVAKDLHKGFMRTTSEIQPVRRHCQRRACRQGWTATLLLNRPPPEIV